MTRLLVALLVPLFGTMLVVAAAVGDAPASAFQRPTRQCFRVQEANGFSSRGEGMVDVRVGAGRQFRLTLAGVCTEIDWARQVALRGRGGSSWVCAGGDAEILVGGPTGPQRCLVTDIRRLTPEEVAASRRRPRR
jgi:Family of unknown function (DUF6491)